jgi:hypothetical protein
MNTLRLAIGLTWAAFWVGWLVAATAAKHGTSAWRQRLPVNGLSARPISPTARGSRNAI